MWNRHFFIDFIILSILICTLTSTALAIFTISKPYFLNSIIYLYTCTILIRVCGNYAAEYDIMFNWNKGKLLFFKGRSSVMMLSEIMVNGQIVGVSEKNSSFRSYYFDDGS